MMRGSDDNSCWPITNPQALKSSKRVSIYDIKNAVSVWSGARNISVLNDIGVPFQDYHHVCVYIHVYIYLYKYEFINFYVY